MSYKYEDAVDLTAVNSKTFVDAQPTRHTSSASPTLSDTLTVTTSILAASTLAACGGGANGAAVHPSERLTASSTTPPPPTSAQAARFLMHAQGFVTLEEIESVKINGYEGWLDLAFGRDLSISAWDWLVSKGYNTAQYSTNTPIGDYALWRQLLNNPDSFRMRVALALSEIFVVSAANNGVLIPSRSFAIAEYWDLLVRNCFGKFKPMLSEITLNPAMGAFLNTRGNKKANLASGRVPDENYAREILQLFSIGLLELNTNGTVKLDSNGQFIPTYTQQDIVQLARVFTGYVFNSAGKNGFINPTETRNPMMCDSNFHEFGASTFMGLTIPANATPEVALEMTIEYIASHKNVAPFISKQLIQRMVKSSPSPDYVNRVSNIWYSSDGDLKLVIKAILLDPEAREDSTLTQLNAGRIREPMLRFIQWARTFGATSVTDAWKVGSLAGAESLNQSPMRSPSVFNFFRPGFVPPLTSIASNNLVAPEMQIVDDVTIATYLNFIQRVIFNGQSSSQGGLSAPSYAIEIDLVAQNLLAGLVDRLNLLLTSNQLSAATTDLITNAIQHMPRGNLDLDRKVVYAAIFLVMASPEYLVQK